jgi:alkyl hydroperoxide reductase subunit AhpF
MAILSERDRTGVREQLATLAGPVKLVVFSAQLGEGAEYAVENERLMREVAECADGVSVEALNLHLDRERAAAYGVDRVPTTVVEGARDHGIRFVGIPMGYEFTNLIDAILVVASGQPALAPETLARLAPLRTPVHLQVFTTPT